MKDETLFADTKLLVAWKIPGRTYYKHASVHLVAESTKSWDGAAPTTNAAVYLDNHGVYAYVELKLTGRAPKTHTHGLFGTKAMMRFTGENASGEWFDAVVHAAA